MSIGGGDVVNDISGESCVYAIDMNEGSNGNCGKITLEVRRNYWFEGSCDPSENRWSEWDDSCL